MLSIPTPTTFEHQIAGKPLLSPEYRQAWQGLRAPLVVELPCGHFCVDMLTMQDVPADHAAVALSVALTLSPSINIKSTPKYALH